MTEVWIDPETKQIRAVYTGCSTNSKIWKEKGYKKYDHVEPWMKPMTPPEPAPPEAPASLELKSPDGRLWEISINNMGRMQAKKKKV